jgi:hypothetical protein
VTYLALSEVEFLPELLGQRVEVLPRHGNDCLLIRLRIAILAPAQNNWFQFFLVEHGDCFCATLRWP